jgi:hypothetical protein
VEVKNSRLPSAASVPSAAYTGSWTGENVGSSTTKASALLLTGWALRGLRSNMCETSDACASGLWARVGLGA